MDDTIALREGIGGFPRVELIQRPTPMHALRRFSARYGGPTVWAKREDCNGFGGGGNKARKLEYLLGDAIRNGSDTLVTVGGLQSNHTRITAAAAAVLGMSCVIVRREWGDSASPEYSRVGNRLLTGVFGAEERLLPGTGRVDPSELEFVAIIDDLRADGLEPYVIPAESSTTSRIPPPDY